MTTEMQQGDEPQYDARQMQYVDSMCEIATRTRDFDHALRQLIVTAGWLGECQRSLERTHPRGSLIFMRCASSVRLLETAKAMLDAAEAGDRAGVMRTFKRLVSAHASKEWWSLVRAIEQAGIQDFDAIQVKGE